MDGIVQFVMKTICAFLTLLSLWFPSIFGSHQCGFCNPDCEHTGGTATCISQAICEKCGEGYGRYAPHQPGEKVKENVVAATCEKGGYYETAEYCTSCKKEVSRKITKTDKLGHDWKVVSSNDPTCLDDGYTTYKCDNCGNSSSKFDKGTALGHNYGDWVLSEPASCEIPGIEKKVCSACGTEKTRETAAIKHDYVCTAITEATCGDAGVRTYTCKNDATHTYTVAIPALGHTEATREENRTEASWGEDGSYTLVTYCSVCQEILKEEEKIIPATSEHNFAVEK